MATYRNPAPYRKPQTYRGSETAPGVGTANRRGNYAAGWGAAAAGGASVASAWNVSAAHAAAMGAPYGDVRGHHAAVQSLPLHDLAARDGVRAIGWDAIATHDAPVRAPIRQHAPFNRKRTLRWEDLRGRHVAAQSAQWRQAAAHGRQTVVPWAKLAAHGLSTSALWHSIVARGGYVALPWGPIGARSAGITIEWPVDPEPQPGVITIPTLPVYVMLPTLSCVRLPDRAPISIFNASLQAEIGSYAWSFSAAVAMSSLALLNAPGGAPTEIELTVNGYVWTFIVEGYDDNRRFGVRTATMRGASRSKLLADPYAVARTYTEGADRDASQLATAELPTGWTLVWDAPDFLVPGGTFGYRDAAPMAAIAQVANAIGAAVLSDPADKVLTVAPAYPTSPWAWAAGTPYAIVPASIITEGDSSWGGGSNADGIYVYAENAGSGALVKLTGSSGATQLPMVVERLAVDADAQRERGRNELAAAGRKRAVSRTVPLFPTPAPTGQPELGVIPLGALLEVEDTDETWRGQVMGVRIDAQRSGTALSVRQHLTIERQYR